MTIPSMTMKIVGDGRCSSFNIMMTIISMCMIVITSTTVAAAEICTSPTNTFTVKIDMFASELGYYQFEECGNVTMPTIGLKLNETYTFLQYDRSNWYHPLGFAMYPDGMMDMGGGSMSHSMSMSMSNCNGTNNNNMPCVAAMYYSNPDTFLGGNDTTMMMSGIDIYRPYFFRSIQEWTTLGNFSVQLKFDDTSYRQDLFYYCHIHQYMSGRIKLLDSDGNVINTEGDIPEIKYPYDQQSSFDESCGTYGLEQYQVPNPMCPSHFACLGGGVTSNTDAVSQYVKCYDAINCHMIAGMTTGFTTSDPIALFIYQMIPHHQNAVNMAKNLLLSNAVVCDDLSNPEENEDCTLQAILRGIINSQNYQVQQMRSYLSSNNLPPTDDCNVYMETIDIISSSSRSYSSGSQ